MHSLSDMAARHAAYLGCAALALLAALTLTAAGAPGNLPVLGTVPLLPVVILAAFPGLAALAVAARRGRVPGASPPPWWPAGLVLAGLGALLALPPVAIDLALPFARDINLPPPDALFFYPAIALVAEVAFHLLPMALLALALPRRLPVIWWAAPVVLVEPLFQVAFLSGPLLQGVLVLGNVALISAAQVWLFLRWGFGAMFGLRIAFYLFWHILWGTLRLELLF